MGAKRVMIAAGGTGGHVFPALAVARQLLSEGVEVVWLGTRGGLEARVVPEAGITIHWMKVHGLRGRGKAAWIGAPFGLALALLQALRAMLRARPSVVLGMGGFVTGPAGIAARLLRKPLLLHEQNAVPGLTNRWLARLAGQLMQGFPNAFSPSLQPVTTGNPVRQQIADIPPPAERLGSRQGSVRLLVLGGSQGAQALNEMVPAALGLLDAEQRPEVWHQTGIKHAPLARKRYQQAGVTARLAPFVEDMAAAYGWADLVIARAGALTVSELATVGLPAILVPYPYAVDDHQRFNAMYLERVQAAIVLPQADLSATRLSGLLRDLAANRQRLLQMAIAARSQGTPQATARVAAACRSAAEIRRGLLKGHAVQS